MALLEVTDIHTYYGAIHALKGLTITVDKGEIVTLIGANGAGKTTTLNTICGIHHPRQGTIALEGKPIHEMPAHSIVGLGVAQSPEGRRVFGRLIGCRKPGDGRVHAQGQGRHQARPGASVRLVPTPEGAQPSS